MSPTNKTEVFDDPSLHAISESYGIPGLQYVTSPEAGIITDNAVLKDERGHSYFAKLYKDGNVENHASSYRAAEALVDSGIPVLLPIRLIDKSYTAHIQGRSLALFPYIEHRTSPPKDDSEVLHLTASMGENLGRMHAVNVPTEDGSIEPIQRWSPEAKEQRHARLRKIVEHIETLPDRNSFDELAMEAATTRLDLLSRIESTHLTQSPLRICHGDFHGHNVLYDQSMDVVAICDWDNAGLANPWVDFFNTFMMQVVANRLDTLATEGKEVATAFISSYIKGLNLTGDINKEELKAGFDTLMQERIGTSWPMYQHYFDNNHRNDDRLEKTYRRSIAYAENYDRIWHFVQDTLDDISLKLSSSGS